MNTNPKTTKQAIKLLRPNMAFISVPGNYAAYEAATALNESCNVLISSNNVTLDEELQLKKKAASLGLLLMGPDANTAIINGVGLGFSNKVETGPIGIVSTGGTAIQAITSFIDKEGLGISQAVSVGSRDLSAAVGAVMTEEALNALNEDPITKIIIVVSKPPNKIAADKIINLLGTYKKQALACFFEYEPEIEIPKNVILTRTLCETAFYACALYKRERIELVGLKMEKNDRLTAKFAEGELAKFHPQARYLRALYSGGSFASEAVWLLKDKTNDIYSNTKGAKDLPDFRKKIFNTIVDFGSYEAMKEGPHPIADYALRCEEITIAAKEEDTAVILFDVVLGYCAHPNPCGVLVPVILKAKEYLKEKGRHITFIAYVCGTSKDKQDASKQENALREAGVMVMPSNCAAVKLAGSIIRGLKEKQSPVFAANGAFKV